MSILLGLARIFFFIFLFWALLHVKKTHLRYLPSRRTRVSRHHGESCVWLERLANALLDMLHEALEDNLTDSAFPHAQSPVPKTWPSPSPHALHGGGANDKDAESALRGAEDAPRSSARKHSLLAALEGRVEALLEDRGLATYAAFCVHSIGSHPPILRAIHLTNLTGPVAPVSGAASAGSALAAAAAVEDAPDGRRAEATHEECRPAPPIASELELEAEVEYGGGVDVSLRADLCILRGRRLPVTVRVRDVEYVKAHIRVRATLQYERATMDSQRMPYLDCTMWLESEPAFSLQLETVVSQMCIRNFFMVLIAIKFLLLRFVRNCLMRRNEKGLAVRIPLPENIVDGGLQQWFYANNDATTTVGSTINPGSFSRNIL